MTDYHFTETADHEAGFAEVFRTRIVPILERYEAERTDYRRKAMTGMGISGGVGAAGAGGGIMYEAPFGLFVTALGGMGAWGVKAYFENKWKKGLGGEVLPVLCDFLGEMVYGDQMVDLGAFSRLGLLPSYNTSTLEDPVVGTHDGLEWAMTEAILKSKSRDSKGRTRTTTVFRGLLFQIAINGPAPRIYFARDRGSALNWFSETFSSSRQGMEKIDLDDPEFEEVYAVYTDNPVAARQFIDPRLTAGLLEVARVERGKSFIACGMEGSWLYLALPRKGDFLGLGSLFKPLTTIEADLHEALADLNLPARVIDRLRGM